ncbi:MAG: type II secretion system F family protein [Alphaproteobacteria bacterium]|nr:type II secretion system F family protein [Alphaproteobacteria bacterium]MCB9696198.1 type II secretion system F family protein [Alphaproteobacteria bacterium]
MNAVLFAFLGLLVFGVAGMFFYGLYVLMNPTRTATDRLRDLQGGGPVEAEVVDIITVDTGGDSGGMGGMASKLGQFAAPTSEEEKSRQRQMLMQAGYKSRHALEIFNGTRVTMALCLPLLVIPMASNSGLTQTAFGALIGSAFGYYAPQLWLTNITDKRKRTLLKSFPDALDLLVSCVEAGLGLDAAFRRVALELETAAPELSREFQIVTHEISAGVPRAEALRHLEHRTGLDEIRSLVNMLTQAERFGSSIAKGLRVHSRMTRQKRMARAEEEAAKVSPKLTIIMVLFLLPTLGLIIMGPAMIKVLAMMGSR